MKDTEFERAGEQVADEEDQLKQLDDIINEPGAVTITDLYGETHKLRVETFNVFKTKEVLKLIAGIKGKVDLVALFSQIQILATPIPNVKLNADGTTGEWTDEEKDILTELRARRADAALEALPKIAEFAPDLLLDFGAIAIISNMELAEAYEGDGIAKLRREKRKWLDLHFDASVPLKLLITYMPHLGINFIMQEVAKLDRTAASLLQNATKM